MSMIASSTRGATSKPSCETNRAARSIRSGSSPNDSDGLAGVSSTPARAAAETAQGIDEFGRTGFGHPHRHRVDGEVAAHQIVVERVTEPHLGVAGHPVVAIGPERGEFQPDMVLLGADGAELDTGVP